MCVRRLHFWEGLTAVRRRDGRPSAQVPEGEAEAEAGGARLALAQVPREGSTGAGLGAEGRLILDTGLRCSGPVAGGGEVGRKDAR